LGGLNFLGEFVEQTFLSAGGGTFQFRFGATGKSPKPAGWKACATMVVYYLGGMFAADAHSLNRAGRPHQKNLAEGEAGRTRGRSAGDVVSEAFRGREV